MNDLNNRQQQGKNSNEFFGSSKPRVLIFTDWYLPGYKAGGQISSCANLVKLLGQDIDFKILCSDRDYLDTEAYTHIIPNKWNRVGNADVFYLSPAQLSKVTIKDFLIEFADYQVYINGIFSKYFSITPLIEANKLGRKITIAPRGMLASGALSIKSQKKKAFLNLAKFLGWYRRVLFHATHSDEAQQIRSVISRKAKIQVVPNLPTMPNTESITARKVENELQILSVARIAREKNTLYAIECLQKINRKYKVNLNFIGPVYDTDYFTDCKALASKLPAHITVSFLGSRPPLEISSALQMANLFFLPTLGENYGHAIIESLLGGVPVLISDKTPWKNLQADNLGADFPLEDQDAYTNFISELAGMNQSEYDGKFAQVSQTAAARVNLSENVSAYKELFA